MKRLILFYSSEKEREDNKVNYLINETKNSLIQFSQKDSKTFFINKRRKNKKEEIIIEHFVLIYNEKLVDLLKTILKNSYEYSKTISNEESTGPFNEPEIYSEIESFVCKSSYEGNEPKSIFHLVAEFFYKYAAGHKMKNGNKRLTFMFMINILRFFGFHFHWTKGKKQNYKIYEEQIQSWVAESHNLRGEDREEYIDKLADWIKSNCTIALEWREK